MAGCQGAQPGPCSAPWWLPPSPAGRATARLAAGAGCAGCWHKPPPADGVNPLRLRRNLGASPRVRRVVFRPVQSSSLAAGVMGRSRTCDNRLSAGLYQTELPVVARLESNQAVPFGGVTTTVPFPSVGDVRHAEHQQNPKGPGRPAPVGRTFVLTPACERSPLALDASSIARCVPACGEWYSTCASC